MTSAAATAEPSARDDDTTSGACPTCGTSTRPSATGHPSLCFDCTVAELLTRAGWRTHAGLWRSPDPEDSSGYTSADAWNEHTKQRLTGRAAR